MDVRLRYNENIIAFSVEPAGDGRFSATFGDRRVDVAFERISEHQIRLSVDGCQTMAFVAETPEGKAVMVDGRTFLLADERAAGTRPRAGAANGPKEVTPPMPAVVTQILVATGQVVEKGQGLLVVSAMKMDTILTAPFAGVVTRINVAEGQKVAPRQVLVDLDPPAADCVAEPVADAACNDRGGS
jgi:biotin carboxyl carrier protein